MLQRKSLVSSNVCNPNLLNMKILSRFILIISLVAVITIAVLAWIYIGWQIGLAGLIAVVAFLIGFLISEKFAVSRRDRHVKSEWGVFCKRIAWAWGAAAIVYAIFYIVIAYLWGDVIDVMPK